MNRLILVAGGALLACAVGLLAAAGPAAAQQTIGADLSQAPDVNFDCTEDPLLAPTQGGTSCTWDTPVVAFGGSPGGTDVPGNGTITQVNLRVGSSTGPMQIVILRALGEPQPPPQPLEVLCCVAEAVSNTFTPEANQVNTISVSLPVGASESSDPEYLDSVGLSILEDGVQIPAVDETSLPLGQGPEDEYVAPAMTPGENVLASDPAGYQLDLQAVFSPAAGSTAHVVGAHVKTAATGHVISLTATREPALETSGGTGELWVAAVARGAFARPPRW